MNLNGKKIVITGAASGIGKNVLEELLAFDCQIVAADLNPENIPEHDAITPVTCDVGVKESVDTLFKTALETLGNIDLFIANAGFAYYESYDKADWDRNDAIYRVNVLSPLYTIGKMAELYPSGGYRVVVTASAMGLLSVPGYAVYSATKASLHGFAEAYRFEPKGEGRLTVVYPIATKTAFFSRAGDGIPVAFPAQSATTVARKIIKGIQRNRRKVSPSMIFNTMLFIDRFLPPVLWIYRKMEQAKFVSWLEKRKS